MGDSYELYTCIRCGSQQTSRHAAGPMALVDGERVCDACVRRSEKRTGRSRARTRDTLERICKRLRGGTPLAHACALEGWPRQRFYEWMEQDEECREEVEMARAEGAELYRTSIVSIAEGNGEEGANANVLLHLVSKLYPDEYADPKVRKEVSGPDGGPQQHEVSAKVHLEGELVEIARKGKVG